MFATFFAGIGAKIIMALLAGGLIVGGYAYWQHVVTSRALLEAQTKALAELQRRQAETIAERNKIWSIVLSLPDGRVRLCATRDPTDGCCQPEPAECKP